MCSLTACELLCYVMHKYGNSPSDTMKAVVLSLYSPNKVMAAKELLYKDSSAMNIDGLPWLVQRWKTDNKARHDVDDIFMLLEALDDRALLGTLPKYVASDLSRVPAVNTGELDMTLLLLRVSALESKMSHVVMECVEAARATLLSGASDVGHASTPSAASEVGSGGSCNAPVSEPALVADESASGAQYAVVAKKNKSVLLPGFRATMVGSKKGHSQGAWDNRNMKLACHAVLVSKWSESKAAKSYDIARQTLRRKLSDVRQGKGVVKKKGGPKCYLTLEQEDELCEVILEMEARLYGLTISDVRAIVYKFCKKNNISNKFSEKEQKAGKKMDERVFEETSKPVFKETRANINSASHWVQSFKS